MTAQDEIDKKRREIRALEEQQERCPHAFDVPQYAPHTTWRGVGPWVPGSTHHSWHRRCSLCGRVETTEKTKSVVRPGAVTGTTTTEHVPDFGEERRPTMKVP